MTDFVRFYTEQYDEDTRLQRHRTEFAATTYILDKLIRKSFHILDVGAGTGAYSFYYAVKGCRIFAIDAVPKYIDIMRSKLKSQPTLDIETHIDDIRHLLVPLTDDFDVVLFMGPIYHIPQQEIRQCLDTCFRALKKGGILVAAYVNAHEGHAGSKYPDMFISYNPVEIERVLGELNLERVYHVPTDGQVFGELNDLAIDNSQPIEKLHNWLDTHQSVLSDPEWLSTSIHGLYVGRKV